MNCVTENQRVWEERWQAAIDSSVMHRRKKKGNSIQRWNKMAADFAQRTSDKENRDKRLTILAWLQELGALTGESRVLDIGAGPGNWSLLLAKAGSHVTALEPADGMADILQGRMEDEGVDNVVIDRRTWQEINLAAEGWMGTFDLVFASMTPGIDGPKSLAKLMAASKGFCYLSAFSGRHWQHWYGDLWKIVFNENLDAHGNDIINPFNLLYAMGYRPEMKFEFWERETNWPRQKGIDDFCTHLAQYTELTEEIKVTVADYVDSHCQNNIFSQVRKGCRGMMVWDINKQLHLSS
ncbi:class I SAM-dependent methyltransferase [Desulforhopalus sp. 52FAK]